MGIFDFLKKNKNIQNYNEEKPITVQHEKIFNLPYFNF